MDALERALTGARRNPIRAVRVQVTAYTAGPPVSLTVQLPDGATAPGNPVPGLSYTVGGWGLALLVTEGAMPVVWPTTF